MANQFAHIELNTDDTSAARKFYKKIFDWKFTDLPEGYSMIDVGAGKEGAGGGLQKKPMAEAPTGWLAYVSVASVKATLKKAVRHGARVVLDYQPIGAMGAIGIFVDPTGATLGLWEAAKAPEKAKKAKKAGEKKAKREDKPKKEKKAKK